MSGISLLLVFWIALLLVEIKRYRTMSRAMNRGDW